MKGACIAVVVGLLAAPLPAAPSGITLEAYAEWHKGHDLIVDGQRVTANNRTRFKGRYRNLDSIPLGYEISVQGTRLPDGRILAEQVDARANGSALGESQIRQATDQVEAKWLTAGAVSETDAKGQERVIGRIADSGSDFARCQRILRQVAPPYVNPSSLRLHVVETKDWNAMAMGNGAIWVYSGLLHDMNDDEVAIVLSHELAHYTYEHSRRQFRKAMWGQLLMTGVGLGAQAIDSDSAKGAVALAGVFSLSTWQNGYSRDLEDQADRVGLRYAYEGGYDVNRGPALWKRFSDKYGSQNSVLNFFMGDHSTASARIANLQREIQLNYARPRS